MKNIVLAILTILMVFATATFSSSQVSQQSNDVQQISTAVMHEVKYDGWKKYGNINLSPLVQSGNYAMVGWSQTHVSGTKLLEKKAGKWIIIAGGGGVLDPRELSEFGINIPPEHANELWRQWNR